ncbi:FAD-binding oxidoreductase [uncultured Jatrophihabitans sp.]|uniref:FAD-binding oxidoreductase n=1 Tax=uncultured Jatrophihabitans sp. TaxID=1610747 RepID=UPI0035CC50DD
MTVAAARIPGFTGDVLTPEHEQYDARRRVWNVLHDRRPALIARCAGPSDVAAALEHARRADLVVAVRGGGHSLPGHSVCDDGVVIDLGLLNEVRVDPIARRATVGGGALLGDVDSATQQHGLVVPAGVISHTGVGGLTLGGGVGRLMRRFGLTIDSLLAARLVTVDGRLVRAAADENPDLFWALRGGGGNFGIVVEFEFALHELSRLPLLAAFHPLDQLGEVLALAQRTIADAPDELLWTSFVRRAPVRPWMPAELVGRPGLMSVIEWSGEQTAGLDLLAGLSRQLAPPAAALDVVDFLDIQRAGDVEFGPGLRTYVKATFAGELTDGLAGVLAERGRLLRSPLAQVEVLSMGGAIRRVAPDATAFPHRDAGWLLNVPSSWRDAADTDYEIGWVRDTYAAIEPHATGGAYSNFMEGDEADSGQVAYGATLRRLQAVKAVWDPDNVFQLNQNIRPLAGPT